MFCISTVRTFLNWMFPKLRMIYWKENFDQTIIKLILEIRLRIIHDIVNNGACKRFLSWGKFLDTGRRDCTTIVPLGTNCGPQPATMRFVESFCSLQRWTGHVSFSFMKLRYKACCNIFCPVQSMLFLPRMPVHPSLYKPNFDTINLRKKLLQTRRLLTVFQIRA